MTTGGQSLAELQRSEDAVVADPQAIAAGSFVDVPGGAWSEAHRAVASPVEFDGQALQPGPVPALGEHTEEILRELDAR